MLHMQQEKVATDRHESILGLRFVNPTGIVRRQASMPDGKYLRRCERLVSLAERAESGFSREFLEVEI